MSIQSTGSVSEKEKTSPYLQEWLPIASSPTEPMFEVLIAGQYDNGVWYVEEGFRNPLGHWNGRKLNPPSHWMPLPPPPADHMNPIPSAEGE